MKTYKVYNQNGLLFNNENGKRLILKEQHEYVIVGSNDSFEEIDTLNKEPTEKLTSEQMKDFVQQKYQGVDYVKLLPANEVLIFKVGLDKIRKGDEGFQYFFLCRLLEDLYAYKKPGKNPRLVDCKCVVEHCISGNLNQFEPIWAESLNKAASNTIMHYFSLKRTSSMSVIKEFRHVTNKDSVHHQIQNESWKDLDTIERILKFAFHEKKKMR